MISHSYDLCFIMKQSFFYFPPFASFVAVAYITAFARLPCFATNSLFFFFSARTISSFFLSSSGERGRSTNRLKPFILFYLIPSRFRRRDRTISKSGAMSRESNATFLPSSASPSASVPLDDELDLNVLLTVTVNPFLSLTLSNFPPIG